MDAIVDILGATLAAMTAVMLAANGYITVLKLFHRHSEANRVATRLAPLASYFRLGGKVKTGRPARHA